MAEYGHNRENIIRLVSEMVNKFLRSRSDKTATKLYYQIQNQYGYAILSGDKELAETIKEMFEQAKQAKNYY